MITNASAAARIGGDKVRLISVLLAAFAVTFTSPATRAQDPAIERLWDACPYWLGTAAEVALKQLQLPTDDAEAVADVTCDVAHAYGDIAANPPSAPPEATAARPQGSPGRAARGGVPRQEVPDSLR